MVFITPVLRSERKIRKYAGTFIDSLRLHLKGGTGGNGLPKYGGVGGQGGNIIVEAKEGLNLKSVVTRWPSKRIVAGHGGNSNSKRILGEAGLSETIPVPVGVTLYREDGTKIADLNEDGSKAIAAKGGYGGSHRTGYLGVKGQTHVLRLDLRLIADVGLVGFPNAGKSTLLKAVSKAKPKIASYPFTTIKPNIGVIEYPDLRTLSMADLPGLIEGAHANIGMGHKFLKHVERTKMLLLIVDVNGFQLSPKHNFRTCLETIILLNKELELYKTELLEKPAMLVVNKMDCPNAKEKYNEIKDKITHLADVIGEFPAEMRPEKALVFDDVLAISAQSRGKDIHLVKDRIRNLLDINDDILRKAELEQDTYILNSAKQIPLKSSQHIN